VSASGRVRRTFDTARECARCEKRIPAGSTVWGWETAGGFVVGICARCHADLEDRLRRILLEEGPGREGKP